jgi:hypothetical protein
VQQGNAAIRAPLRLIGKHHDCTGVFLKQRCLRQEAIMDASKSEKTTSVLSDKEKFGKNEAGEKVAHMGEKTAEANPKKSDKPETRR